MSKVKPIKAGFKFCLTCVAALCAAAAQAGVGLIELPGLQGDGPVTVYYPTVRLHGAIAT